jgi:hypothetical protein
VEGETHGEEPRLYGPGQADELVSVAFGSGGFRLLNWFFLSK